MSAIRRRTVRRLIPSVRAIASSLAPVGELLQQHPAQVGPRPGPALQARHGRGPLPGQLEEHREGLHQSAV